MAHEATLRAQDSATIAAFSATPASLKSDRIISVDVLRGIALVVMALDHTRDYFTYLKFTPEDLSQTWAGLFFTRWVTHFCAPTFFFLAGTSAYLSVSHGKSVSQVSRFLWTRGLWLVLLEFTVVAFGWAFQLPFAFAQTIWALGWSMVVLALLVRLPVRWIAAFGIAMIALHNLTDGIEPSRFGHFAWLWTILHVPGLIWIIPGKLPLIASYSLIPWMGVMATGYAFGALLKLAPERKRRTIFLIGAFTTLAFLVLRGGNIYGNSSLNYSSLNGDAGYRAMMNGPWHAQSTLTLSIISFLDVQKYPPSLQFLLMTLGPAMILFAWLDRGAVMPGLGKLTGFLLVYGRVPMLFYVAHIYLVHGTAALVAKLSHQPADWLMHGAVFLNPIPPGYGHGLPFIYGVWLAITIALYWPCRKFAELKARRKDWWLSYL